MCICVYVYTCICVYVYMCTCVHTCITVCVYMCMYVSVDSLRGSSVKIGTIQRRLAWPLRKDDTHKSRSDKCVCIYRYTYIDIHSPGLRDLLISVRGLLISFSLVLLLLILFILVLLLLIVFLLILCLLILFLLILFLLILFVLILFALSYSSSDEAFRFEHASVAELVLLIAFMQSRGLIDCRRYIYIYMYVCMYVM